jgi:hypothetical protein
MKAMRTPRDELETTVAEYHHLRSEHERAGGGGSVRRHQRARLDRLEEHFDRLLHETVADGRARAAWRRRLHEGLPAPAEPRPERPLVFKGRSPEGSVVELRERPDGDRDVLVDGARVERLAPAREHEESATFRLDDREFREIFEAPPDAIAAARAYVSAPAGEPPWEHAAALAADGLIDATFALTPRGRRALGARREWEPS